MFDEGKISEAMEAKAREHHLSPDLAERIKTTYLRTTAARNRFWARRRLGLEIAAACCVIAGLIAIAFIRQGKFRETTPDGTAATQPSPSVSRLRGEVSFPIFVPTAIPAGLVPQPPKPPGVTPTVQIVYLRNDGTVGLRVTNGPAGCCLDADLPRKKGEEIRIRNGITAHFLSNQPEFGGPILWWNEAGAYVAISGPYLTMDELIQVAQSMSPSADIGTFTPLH